MFSFIRTLYENHKALIEVVVHFIFTLGKRQYRHIVIMAIIANCVVTFSYFALYRPPANFPLSISVNIPEGMTLTQIAENLAAHNIIRSPKALVLAVSTLGSDAEVQSGDYFFDEKQSVIDIAIRLLHADYGLLPVRVRIPEGAQSYQIAEILNASFENFSKDEFLRLARASEGYLFPDTYFFLPNSTPAQIIEIMQQNFYKQIEPLEERILSSGHTLNEIVTMASLLEKEARWLTERRIIAGILWNRMRVNMPLQVDAVFGFIHSTNTFHPSFSDLTVESPYNTYRNKGLPPGPIANPSLVSIEAAATPTDSDYLFYLTGRDGKMYYSETFAQHVQNKYRYLK